MKLDCCLDKWTSEIRKIIRMGHVTSEYRLRHAKNRNRIPERDSSSTFAIVFCDSPTLELQGLFRSNFMSPENYAFELCTYARSSRDYTTSEPRPASAFLALSIDVSNVPNFLAGTPSMNISSSSTNDLFFVSLAKSVTARVYLEVV